MEYSMEIQWLYVKLKFLYIGYPYFDGILPKGPYPPCLRMSERALLAEYPRFTCLKVVQHPIFHYYNLYVMIVIDNLLASLNNVWLLQHESLKAKKG